LVTGSFSPGEKIAPVRGGSTTPHPAANLGVKVCICVLLISCVLALGARAHVVSQIYAEWLGENPWEIQVLFDAGYAVPEWRGDALSPAPTRAWLLALDDAKWAGLREEAERYLRECLEIRAAGQPVSWQVEFLDFKISPPDFPVLLNDGAYFRMLVRCGDLAGQPTEIAWREGNRPSLVVKLPGREGNYLSLDSGEVASIPNSAASGNPGRVATHESFRQGFLHVLPLGLDHILFVLGLFFYQRAWRPLLAQSLAFTAAHTLTLGLAAAGIVPSQGPWIEPLIALSLVVIALENLHSAGNSRSRLRLAVVFGFGLIHGLGFAGALAVWLVPGEGFLKSLLSANLGVEAGQLAVIAAAWIFTLRWHLAPTYQTARKLACLGIAAIGAWMLVQRIASLG
jgi:hypothetical protein